MAPPRIGRAARMVAVALAAIAAHPAASAQDARENAVERAVGAALRAGDFRQAAAILERMAKSGNAEAQYQLASLYRSGRGVAQDDALAFKWMQAAAEQGHVRAQFNLGTMYVAGRGAARDDAKGRAWLENTGGRLNCVDAFADAVCIVASRELFGRVSKMRTRTIIFCRTEIRERAVERLSLWVGSNGANHHAVEHAIG